MPKSKPARQSESPAADPSRTAEALSQPPSADAAESPKRKRPTGVESHARFPSTSTSDPAQTLAFAIDAARLAADDKCDEVILLDVRKVSQLTDYMLICSGTSDRQMHTVAQDIDELAAKHNYPVFRRHSDDRTTWIVVDCVDVVAHIFEPNARAHYDLEMLWADAPRIEWERPDQKSRDRAGLGA